MHLTHLSLINFKCYEEAEMAFSPQVNCFVGNNGVGKTNLLDAIYYLSMCKSYFNPIDSQNIRFDESFFMVQGVFQKDEKEDSVACAVKKGQKKQIRRNKKEYQKLADHIGLYPVVMITPYDVDLLHDGSEVRRKFIDSIISQFDRTYLDCLMRYNKALAQRNTLLKYFAANQVFEADSLEVWDRQLVDLGEQVYKVRQKFLETFIPVFQEYFKKISQDREAVDIHYRSHHSEGHYEALLADARHKDRILQHTSRGVHKDDLLFQISGHPIKKFGSQGQQKSFLIALKLAQYQTVRDIKGVVPILLLDDIFDKLDTDRVKQLMELVSDKHFGQIFITDTDHGRVPGLFADIPVEFKQFTVTPNEVTHEAR